MSAVATLRAWLYRLAASVPSAWHYDRLFRWMVIGAGVSFVVFVFRPPNPADPRPISSAPISSVSASLGPTYGAPPREHLSPLLPPAPPNIGAVAIIHAAPDTPTAAQEIPSDSVGGFIYTGGPLQLADLTDHGVRCAGLAGVEWQGWLRAREAGRYELDVDGSTVSPNNFTLNLLEDRSIGIQEAKPRANLSQPAAFSLILGAELQPGLYKLRLWAACTPTHHSAISVSRSCCWKKPRLISTCARSPAKTWRTSNARACQMLTWLDHLCRQAASIMGGKWADGDPRKAFGAYLQQLM